MSELTIQFGLRVRDLRIQKGITQENLAFICNLDRSYMGRIERGEVNPTLERVYEIARALGISPYDLLPPSNVF